MRAWTIVDPGILQRPRFRTLVAHEPPAAQVLPDREEALAASVDIRETYQRNGVGPAMAKFIRLASHKGPIQADFGERAGCASATSP